MLPTVAFYGDKSGSMARQKVNLAASAFLDLAEKGGFSERNIQLGLINTTLEKIPVGRHTSDFFKQYVRHWQQTIGGSTRIWETVFEDVESLRMSDLEVVIVTDGLDNTSGGKFLGPRGAHHLADKLRQANIEKVSFNIVGIGKLPSDVSEVFETIASVTGGIYHNIASMSDLPAFSSRFVKAFTDAVAAPKAHVLRVRERQVDARMRVGIYDDLVVNHQAEATQALKKELEAMKEDVAMAAAESQALKEEVTGLKDHVAEVQHQQQDLKNLVEEFKAEMEGAMRMLLAQTVQSAQTKK